MKFRQRQKEQHKVSRFDSHRYETRTDRLRLTLDSRERDRERMREIERERG